MVKRRRLEAPSSSDLDRMEQEFRSETSANTAPGRGLAPIAQVAAESAAEAQAASLDVRAARAQTEADAARLKKAEEQGLLMIELPVADIDEGALVRDRMSLGEEEQAELRLSIATNGLRLPIEVFELENQSAGGKRYGLLSGYRRLLAVRGLLELTEAAKYSRIRAIIRERSDADAAFVAMVEENEVRQELSHFERGRIAVIAANQGAFANTEEAVNKLFATGSKAKRSKVRSFALVFEELGDMLVFPEALTEKRGLRLASALRFGAEVLLRQALAERVAEDADQEWALIEQVLIAIEKNPRDASRGGRPKSKPKEYSWIDSKTVRTSSGITIRCAQDSKGHILRFEGEAVDNEIMNTLMMKIRKLLEP